MSSIKQIIFIFLAICFSFYSTAQQSLSLDGEWEIIFDHDNLGKDQAWIKSEVFDKQSGVQTIIVPSAWELIEQDYEGVAFYKHSFTVPESWEDKVVRLHFGAVNYLSEVWLNNEVVGFNEGGFTPFEFRVDAMLKAGEENTIMLRVMGPLLLSDKNINGYGKLETAQWRGGITGGIWQPVRLDATDEIYVEDVYIQPNIHDQTASLQVTLDNTAISSAYTTVKIKIVNASNPDELAGEVLQSWKLHPGINEKQWKIDIPNATHWSPANPHLYLAIVSLVNNNKISDKWAGRFGMRELTIKNKDYFLNGEPIYIKATFFEGLYPNGIAYPDSEEMIRTEIQLAKEAGFNMIRPWRRPPDPRWLDIADEMGVLVVASPALECMTLPLSTAYLPKRVEHEVRQTILRDRNRACIVQWELFNELHRPVLNQLMRPMANLARSLDPTRLILDESGGWAFGANMYLPHQYEPTKFNDIHNYPGAFINEKKYDGYLSIGMTVEEKAANNYTGPTPGKNVVPGLMSFVSELGYGSLPDLTVNNKLFAEKGNELTPAYRYHKRLDKEQREMLVESGFNNLYPDMQQFYLDQQQIHGAANKRMIEAVRANPDVDGYCIHALSAGDWILGAGLIDLWRNPKTYAFDGTKDANQDQIISIRSKPRNIYANSGTSIEIIGINDLAPVEAVLKVEVVSDEGKIVYNKEVDVEYINRVSQLLAEDISTKNWNGGHTIQASLTSKDGKVLTENSTGIYVWKEKNLRVKKSKVAVTDASGELTQFLKSKGLQVVTFTEELESSIPLFVTGIMDESVKQFIMKGAKAILITGMPEKLEDENAFPFNAKLHPGQGLWTCIPHLVHDHPFFTGLPVDTVMRNEYENIWPTHTLRDIHVEGDMPVETIVATIGFDWFSREHQLQYSGPGASWWGSDVARLSIGQGELYISQLRLVENLGKDPFADKILSNMIHHLLDK